MSAVLTSFTGATSGDLLIAVDEELSSALRSSPFGELDLAAALQPTVQAIGATIGQLTLGPVQVVDARVGLSRVLSHGDAAIVPLTTGADIPAAVALGFASSQRDASSAPPSGGNAGSEAFHARRLDLLRGVEMDATAELGRARMTINDLLSLRPGAVIELDRTAGAPADIYVNGRLIAHAEVVIVDENYGVRITQIVADGSAR
jgi:flagellar motor switch protein FliN/FliY